MLRQVDVKFIGYFSR